MKNQKLQTILDSFSNDLEKYIEEEVRVRIGDGVSPSVESSIDITNELEELLSSFSRHESADRERQTEELISLLEGFGSKSSEKAEIVDNSSLKDFFSSEKNQPDSTGKIDSYIDKLGSLQTVEEVATMDSSTPKSGISYALELLKKYKAKISK